LHYLIAHMIDACMHSDNTIVGSAYTNLYLLIGLCLFCVLLISAACIWYHFCLVYTFISTYPVAMAMHLLSYSVWWFEMLLLFLLMSKGGERLFASMLQDTYWPSSKRGRLLKGGACSTPTKMILMMSKVMHLVHH